MRKFDALVYIGAMLVELGMKVREDKQSMNGSNLCLSIMPDWTDSLPWKVIWPTGKTKNFKDAVIWNCKVGTG